MPAIVPEDVWEAAQTPLRLNALHSRRNTTRHRYFLSGLVRCPRCGGTYTGVAQHGHRLYRCGRAHPANSSTGQRCPPGSIGADRLEETVWDTAERGEGAAL